MSRTLACRCPFCAETRPTGQALGAHKRHAHPDWRQTKSGKSVLVNQKALAKVVLESKGEPYDPPPVPIPCATCFVRMPEVEKGLAILMIRWGLTIERAQKAVLEYRRILQKYDSERITVKS